VSSKFKVPSSKLLQIVELLKTPVRIQQQEGDHDFEL
jgi:hypothetical protein